MFRPQRSMEQVYSDEIYDNWQEVTQHINRTSKEFEE